MQHSSTTVGVNSVHHHQVWLLYTEYEISITYMYYGGFNKSHSGEEECFILMKLNSFLGMQLLYSQERENGRRGEMVVVVCNGSVMVT